MVTRESKPTSAMLVPFERNAEFVQANPMQLFSETDGIIAKGTRAMATVVDVQPSFVTIDLNGVQAFIPATDLSWEHVRDCNHYTKVDEKFEVEVMGADPNSLEVYASRKACLPKMVDTLSDGQVVGKVLNVHMKGHEGRRSPKSFCFGVIDSLGATPVRIYEDEVEWGDMEHPLKRVLSGQRFTALGLVVDRERGFVVASKKRILADKWDEIRRKYPHGKLIIVTVLTVAQVCAICEVESGLCGLVPESEFMLAGLEYRNFRTNLKPGHQLYVSVGRVVSGKRQRLSLCLQRNTLQGLAR
jgi:ribosomal protein S1